MQIFWLYYVGSMCTLKYITKFFYILWTLQGPIILRNEKLLYIYVSRSSNLASWSLHYRCTASSTIQIHSWEHKFILFKTQAWHLFPNVREKIARDLSTTSTYIETNLSKQCIYQIIKYIFPTFQATESLVKFQLTVKYLFYFFKDYVLYDVLIVEKKCQCINYRKICYFVNR